MIGTVTPTSLRDVGRRHAGRVDDHLGLDLALIGDHAADAAAGIALDRGHVRARVDLGPVVPRTVGQREGQLAGVEVAVARQERRALHAVRGHQREALLRLGRADDLEREPERLGPAGLALDLLHARLRRGQADAAELVPAGILAGLTAQRGVQLDGVHHHPRQRHRRAQLAHQAGGVPGRAVGQIELLDEHDVLHAELGEVVGDAAAAHAAADDDSSSPALHAAKRTVARILGRRHTLEAP